MILEDADVVESAFDERLGTRYTSVASGATNARITFVGGSTKPAGTGAQFTIEAVDGGGNLDASNTATVNLTGEVGGGLEFSLQSNFSSLVTQATLQSGSRTVYVRGTLVGTWDVTAGGGGLGSDTKVLTVTPGSVDHYVVSTVAGVTAGANFNVSVTARDQYNNLVDTAGNSITLAAIDDVTTNPALSTLSVTNAALASGQVTVGEAYTTAEAIRVRVTDAASRLGTSGVVTVSAATAHRIIKGTGDASNVVAGAGQTLNAQVVDLYDNPVANDADLVAVVRAAGGPVPQPRAADPLHAWSPATRAGTARQHHRQRPC